MLSSQVREGQSPAQISKTSAKDSFYVTRSFDGKKFSPLFEENKENENTNSPAVRGLVVKGISKAGRRSGAKGSSLDDTLSPVLGPKLGIAVNTLLSVC